MLDSANVTTTPRPVVKFVGFEFDLTTGELRKAGMRIKLQEQPTQVLIALVERAGNDAHDQTQQRRFHDQIPRN